MSHQGDRQAGAADTSKIEALRTLIKEMLLNMESVVEEGRRAIRRAQEQLDRLDHDS